MKKIVLILMLLSVNCYAGFNEDAKKVVDEMSNKPITISVLIAEYEGLSEVIKKYLGERLPNYTLFIKLNRKKSIDEEISLIRGRLDLIERKMKLENLSEGL
jgi:hypothetical protein